MNRHRLPDNDGSQERQKTEGWPPLGEKPESFLDEIFGENEKPEKKSTFQDSFAAIAAGVIQVMILILLVVLFVKMIVWLVML